MSQYIFDNELIDGNKKQIGKHFLPHLHNNIAFSEAIQRFFTHLDTIFYSEELRKNLYEKTKIEFFKSSEQTREHIYKFYIKGSNVLVALRKYLEYKTRYSFKDTHISDVYGSDWDSTFLINPSIPQDIFNIIRDEIIDIIIKECMECSRKLEKYTNFYESIKTNLYVLRGYIHGNLEVDALQEYHKFNGWTFRFNSDIRTKLHINDNTKDRSSVKKLIKEIGETGKGFRVTSNRKVPKDPSFYLARILANVEAVYTPASDTIGITNPKEIVKQIPVEIIDVSLSYEREFEWKTHREYHIHYNGFDYRILSAVGYYVDQVKTIHNTLQNTGDSKNKTRRINTRMKYIRSVLENILVPYEHLNTDIQDTMRMIQTSDNSFVRRTGKTLKMRMQNKKIISPENVLGYENI